MLIRIGETRWANLYGVREINIGHVKTLGSEEVKFCVWLHFDNADYNTDPVDTKEEAIAQAEQIAEQLNSKLDY